MTRASTPLRAALRPLLTASWLLIALAYLALFLLDLGLDYAQVRIPCTGSDCNYLAISPSEAEVLESWGLSAETYARLVIPGTLLVMLVYLVLSVLILWRMGATRFGWMVSMALVVIPVTTIADSNNVVANYPELLVPAAVLSILGVCVFMFFFYIVPNGSFYPRWAVIPFIISLPIMILFFQETTGVIRLPPGLRSVFENLALGSVFLVVVFQVLRYRQFSSPVERQQTKWILFGLVAMLVGLPFWLVFFGGGAVITPGLPRLMASVLGWILVQITMTLLPVTIALAILRHKLWDIDLVIRRTLIYGALTALMLGLYFGSVVVLQGTIGRLLGEADSPVATVISTLAIAALFNPLRSRVQSFIDSRFYRSRYNAEQSLARFAAAARDEVDLERLAEALQGVVEETMRPERASLWLRRPGGARR